MQKCLTKALNYTQVEVGIATGYDEEQTFNTSDYTGLWQVLYNDEEHGLQIISADVVTENLYLGNDTDEEKAKIGYNNYVDTLNAFCNNYTDIKYAVSGRSVGSDPLNPKDKITDTYTLPFEYNGSKESGFKVKDDNKYFDNEAMKSAISQNSDGIDFINKDYWLASRYGLTSITSKNASIYVSIMPVSSAHIRFFCVLYPDNSSNPYGNQAGVRPVIILKSVIQTSNGNGSESSLYELLAMTTFSYAVRPVVCIPTSTFQTAYTLE